MKLPILIALTLFLITACGGNGDGDELPTLAPTFPPDAPATEVPPTEAEAATDTPLPPTAAETTDTPAPPTDAVAPTAAAGGVEGQAIKEPNVPLAATLIGTRIAGAAPASADDVSPVVIAALPTNSRPLTAEEQPVFATLTPGLTNSSTSAGSTPQMIADVVITEAQFQEELDRFIGNSATIERAVVDFQTSSIILTMTAGVEGTSVTGDVVIGIELGGQQSDGNRIIGVTVSDIIVDGNSVDFEDTALPPSTEGFITVVNTELFGIAIQTINQILNRRVGDVNNLEILRVTDTTMEATLLVPQQ